MQSAVENLDILKKLAGEHSKKNQLEIMHRIVDLFFITADQHKQNDIDAFGLALDQLAYKLKPEERQQLAVRFAEAQTAPRNLIIKLANDKIIVAQPVLEKSPCLTDPDLVTIIDSKGTEHQLAICDRSALTPFVTDALIRNGEEKVLCSVTKNEAADFSLEGYHTLSERAKTLKTLRATLKKRANLPSHNFDDMTKQVMQKIKDELMQKVSEIVDVNIAQLVETKIAELKSEQTQSFLTNVTEQDMSQAFKFSKTALRRPEDPKRDLNEFALTGHARAMRIPETVRTLSALTHISPQMAAHCLFNADLSSLGVLCKANQFSRETFSALLRLRVVRKKISKSVVADALQRYDVLSYEKALKVMDFLEKRLIKEAEIEASQKDASQALDEDT